MNRTARRRYEKEFPKILRKDGDNCGVCRAPLTHNAQTFGGLLPNGEVVLTSNCCVRKLETVMGSGIYINQNTDAIVSCWSKRRAGRCLLQMFSPLSIACAQVLMPLMP